MNKKISFYLVLATVIMLSGSVVVFAKAGEVGEKHRSDVVKVVQELEKVADKDEAIKDEVKTVAKEEDEMSKSVSDKIKKVEDRSGFKTFLIGSDYKSLGELRSEIVTTENRINRLTNALERMTGTTTKAELETQITELKTIQTKAESFIKAQEGKFSLFGWLVKMFQ